MEKFPDLQIAREVAIGASSRRAIGSRWLIHLTLGMATSVGFRIGGSGFPRSANRAARGGSDDMTESNETPALPGAGGSGVHLQGRMKARAAATSAIAFEPPRFPLVSFEDIKPSLQRSYLVKGLLPREGLVVVWGAPKSGKSFWVFDLAMHIALGWEYRGRRVTQGAVVYVACEGEAGFKLRVEAFRRANAMQLAIPGADTPRPCEGWPEVDS